MPTDLEHHMIMASTSSDVTDHVTPLMMACKEDRSKDVKRLIKRKDTLLLASNDQGRTAIHYCAENETTKCIDLILSKEPKLLNVTDHEGFSVLHLSIISGNTTVVKYLLAKGADVNALDKEKHSTVHWATVCRHLSIIDMLLEYHADPSTPDGLHAFPLHYAAQMSVTDESSGVLDKLLSKGVKVDCVDQDNRQPLLWAASAGSSVGCRTLIKAGVSVTCCDNDGLTALHCAASQGHCHVITTLLEEFSMDVNSEDANGCTALFYASTLGHLECVAVLLDHGADVGHQDKRGRSSMHCAASKGELQIIEKLRSKSGLVWSTSNKGEYPLHEAVQAKQIDVVKYFLLDRREKVNSATLDGRTCLHYAAINGSDNVIDLLIKYGAKRNVVMKYKESYISPYDAAKMKKNMPCALHLRYHGVGKGSKIVNKAAQVIQCQVRKYITKKREDTTTAEEIETTEDCAVLEPEEVVSSYSSNFDEHSEIQSLPAPVTPKVQESPRPKTAIGNSVRMNSSTPRDRRPKSSIAREIQRQVKIYNIRKQTGLELTILWRLNRQLGTRNKIQHENNNTLDYHTGQGYNVQHTRSHTAPANSLVPPQRRNIGQSEPGRNDEHSPHRVNMAYSPLKPAGEIKPRSTRNVEHHNRSKSFNEGKPLERMTKQERIPLTRTKDSSAVNIDTTQKSHMQTKAQCNPSHNSLGAVQKSQNASDRQNYPRPLHLTDQNKYHIKQEKKIKCDEDGFEDDDDVAKQQVNQVRHGQKQSMY